MSVTIATIELVNIVIKHGTYHDQSGLLLKKKKLSNMSCVLILEIDPEHSIQYIRMGMGMGMGLTLNLCLKLYQHLYTYNTFI